MRLDYLDFDYSEDEDGNATWDAMASVPAARWEVLLGEVQQVLTWASRDFGGRRGALDEGADWDFDLQAQDDDHGSALPVRWDGRHQTLSCPPPQAGGYGTLTLSLTGNAYFADGLRSAFELE